MAPIHHTPCILLIENDAGNRFLAQRILKGAGYRLLSATHGLEGLTVLEHNHVDVIITDLSMPVLDGFEFVERIHHMPEYEHTPVIALTAHAFAEEQQQALDAGCSTIITKPYRPKELLQAIELILATIPSEEQVPHVC